MMQHEMAQPDWLITPQELPVWVPGKVVCASDSLGWRDIGQRTYRYKGQDVEIPAMDSFMIVQYRHGATPMERQFDGRWTRTTCCPGDFSLLSRSAESHWSWTEDVEVTHLYLSDALLCRVAGELEDGAVAEVHLHDVLRASDSIISHVANEVTREAKVQGPGGQLYVEALALQLAVHLLRNYATCVPARQPRSGGLSPRQLGLLEDYVEEHLHEAISLEEMASCLGLGVWTFARRLRQSLEHSAHAYVVAKRVERAQRLLVDGDLALKEVAAACGFADQAHMTRTFRAKLGATPGQVRGSA